MTNKKEVKRLTTSEIKEMVTACKEIFDDVFIVEPMTHELYEVSDGLTSKLVKKNGIDCSYCCFLKNDAVGCICKNLVNNAFRKCRFTISGRRSYMVIGRPFKYRSTTYNLIASIRVDSDFAFGSKNNVESVTEITNISSSLVIDALTDIFNRKYLNDNIDFLINKHSKEKTDLSLACIDIDNFKKFNDSYGHDFGDKVLKKLADEMKQVQAKNEHCIPIRIGGDEFMFVGDGISRKRMQAYMEALCASVRSTYLRYGTENVGICISIGVSGMKESGCNSYKELYERADESLYGAKKRGKNCVVAL